MFGEIMYCRETIFILIGYLNKSIWYGCANPACLSGLLTEMEAETQGNLWQPQCPHPT